MSDSTLTRYLKLKVAADLSADAKYNLQRIDSLGFLATVNDDDSLNLVARGDVYIEPNSPDISGTGVNGTINLGASRNPPSANIDVVSYARSFLINAGFKLLNSTPAVSPATTKSLEIKYTSDTNTADRSLTVDVKDANRSISIEDSGKVVTVDGAGSNSSIEELTGLTTPLSVSQGGTGRVGPDNDPHALDELVPVYTAAERGFALAVDPADEANGLIWREFEAGGTVTNVELDVDAVPELTLSATSNPITTAGTFTLSKTSQSANLLYASPNGSAGVPTFRSLVKADLPSLTTTDIAEGTNQYFTTARAQSAVVVSVLNQLDTTHSPSSSAVLTQLNLKEPTITAGTTSQYWRGDKSWQTLNTDAVSEGSNQYFTSGRAQTAAVVDSTAGSETTQAPSVSAVKLAIAAASASGLSAANWSTGSTFALTHGFGTKDVLVAVYDIDSSAEIYVDSVVRNSVNEVTLTASEAPSGSGWRVLVRR